MRAATAPVSSSVLASTRRTPFSLLYPILDAAFESYDSLAASIEALGRAGCRLVQLRAKTLTAREFLRWADLSVEVSRRLGMDVIINDRADVALLSGARGVHLGQDDLSVDGARRILGDDALIGLSTHTLDQAERGEAGDADYVAIGPVFATESKARAGRALGPDYVRRVRAVVQKPLVAIGGITLARAPEIIATGIDSVAVISALKTGAPLEEEAMKWLALSE